eukprot:2453886-Rhodomonas_salina.2
MSGGRQTASFAPSSVQMTACGQAGSKSSEPASLPPANFTQVQIQKFGPAGSSVPGYLDSNTPVPWVLGYPVYLDSNTLGTPNSNTNSIPIPGNHKPAIN